MSTKHYPPVEKALKKYYGYDTFRPGQLDLIQAVLDGRDVCGIMPTGAGKSVCFQIPAVFLEGITLVISPLISLMKDQVAALIQAHIPAAYLNSSLSFEQYRKALWFAKQGRYKIIYVAPERLNTPGFLDFAKSVKISMIAVDEAHCVSQWGQNFRPSYLEIAKFAASLDERPILAAFTATATGPVKDDIITLLGLEKPRLLVTGFDRANLFFEVRRPKDKFRELLSFLKEHPEESGIIYCLTRRETEETAQKLEEHGYRCGRYHAGLSAEERTQVQDDFQYDRLPLICATNAFGMGIDKSNVRFVVHYSMPSSLENYYQEAGRAGRDGAPAHCLLFYKVSDVMTNKFLIEKSNEETPDQLQRDLHRLHVMENYCTTPMCLRSYILQYFGEPSKGQCSGCANCTQEWIEEDITEQAGIIASAIRSFPRPYGLSVLLSFLKGRRSAKLRESGLIECAGYGAFSSLDPERIRMLAESLLMQGLLIRSSDRWQTLSVSSELEKRLENGAPVLMRRRAKPAAEPKRSEKADRPEAGFESRLFEKLKAVRLEAARAHRIPPYLVFSDVTLAEIARRLPQTSEQLLEIAGIGQYKCDRYGPAVLEAVKEELLQSGQTSS